MEMKEQNDIERNIVYSELLILLQNADNTIRSNNKKLEVKDIVEPNSHYNITEDAARILFSVDDISSSIFLMKIFLVCLWIQKVFVMIQISRMKIMQGLCR